MVLLSCLALFNESLYNLVMHEIPPASCQNQGTGRFIVYVSDTGQICTHYLALPVHVTDLCPVNCK